MGEAEAGWSGSIWQGTSSLYQAISQWQELPFEGHSFWRMQGGGSAPPSRDVESPMDEGRHAVDAIRDHGVHGPEPVFTLRAGVGLESGLFVGWVLVKTWPNPATFLPWYLKLAATFKVAGFLKLRHWVIARGENIFPPSCLSGWCFVDWDTLLLQEEDWCRRQSSPHKVFGWTL